MTSATVPLEVMERDPSVARCYPRAYLTDATSSTLTSYDDTRHLLQAEPADRFQTLLDTIRLAHQHLGVTRVSGLRHTHLLGTNIASDVNLLAELSLYRHSISYRSGSSFAASTRPRGAGTVAMLPTTHSMSTPPGTVRLAWRWGTGISNVFSAASTAPLRVRTTLSSTRTC